MVSISDDEKLKISLELLPEARVWRIGKKYRVEMVLLMTGIGEDNADFEIVDAKSLSYKDKLRHGFMTGNKYHE